MIHIIFREKISIPKFAVLARSKQLHSEVSILVCGLQGHLLWHRGILQKSAPRFHLTKATKQWRIVAIPYQKAWGPWEGHAARSTGAADASIMHAKDRVVVSKIWIARYCANPWRIVHIQLLATVGWKWGCQPFSCPCSRNVMHCRKQICLTCLSKESIPFVKSKPPLPTRSLRSLRAAVCSTNSALCLYHAHPFVAAAEKNESHAKKQRVWSRSCGLQDLLSTYNTVIYSDCVQGFGYRVLIVLSVVTRDCCKPMKSNEQLSRLTRLRF